MTVHLINSLWSSSSGSELRTVTLYEELKAAGVETFLWTEHRPDPLLASRYPIRRIHPLAGIFPRGGTQVFVGAYLMPRWWTRLSRAARTIVIHNTFTPERFLGSLKQLSAGGRRVVEVVYTSELIRRMSDVPGIVQLSPIRLEDFSGGPGGGGTFTIGRHSRDVPEKHHTSDPALYREVVLRGGRVRILGGTVLGGELDAETGIELLPASAMRVREFLHSLDVFFYRTSARWLEPLGRVVFEAMASSVPVVCERRGGYVDYIEDGVSGFLFDTDAEALDILERLRADPGLRRTAGAAARRAVESLLSPETLRHYAEFYAGTALPDRVRNAGSRLTREA